MHSRAQLALSRPGTEVTALRELFAELLTEPAVVRRLSDLVSGAENRYAAGPDAHPLVGQWVPDIAVENGDGVQRVAELARTGRPLLIDLTQDAVVAAASSAVAERVTITTGRAFGDVSATALLVRPDGYVAWASSAPRPDDDELRRVFAHWGIETRKSTISS
jgi:hypothetical protein